MNCPRSPCLDMLGSRAARHSFVAPPTRDHWPPRVRLVREDGGSRAPLQPGHGQHAQRAHPAQEQCPFVPGSAPQVPHVEFPALRPATPGEAVAGHPQPARASLGPSQEGPETGDQTHLLTLPRGPKNPFPFHFFPASGLAVESALHAVDRCGSGGIATEARRRGPDAERKRCPCRPAKTSWTPPPIRSLLTFPSREQVTQLPDLWRETRQICISVSEDLSSARMCGELVLEVPVYTAKVTT